MKYPAFLFTKWLTKYNIYDNIFVCIIKMEVKILEYMTVSEVANKYKVSKQAVFKWIKEGILKAEKIAGSTIRIKVDEVEKLRKEVN